MIRSYDVSFEFQIIFGQEEEKRPGWLLVCFEDDVCVHEQFFLDSDVAHAMGHRFLDGLYVKGFPIEELV